MTEMISNLRNTVDYTDTTLNEPRYCEDGTIDCRVFYPHGNIYLYQYDKKLKNLPHYNKKLKYLPHFYCDDNSKIDEYKFNDKLKYDQIFNAITFLQIEPLKKYIVKNYYHILLPNPFLILYNTEYPIDKNLDAAKEIIQILIDNYDDHYQLITKIEINCKKDITELLYSFLEIDEDKICSLCLQSEPKKLLINNCSCKQPIHANCLVEIIKKCKTDKCKVCLTKYKINEPFYKKNINNDEIKDDSIYFPHNDFYYQPLTKNMYKFTGISRLMMAIYYLQVDRVKELLEEKEILEQLPNYTDNYGHTPIIILCQGNMITNCNILLGNNIIKYMMILTLLLQTKKINLEHKDMFNKNYLYYIEQNKLWYLKPFFSAL